MYLILLYEVCHVGGGRLDADDIGKVAADGVGFSGAFWCLKQRVLYAAQARRQ